MLPTKSHEVPGPGLYRTTQNTLWISLVLLVRVGMCPQRTTRRAHELLGETAAPKCLGRPQNAAETILPELRQRQTTEFPETLATAKRGTFRTPPSSLRICCRASIKVSHGALAKRPATQQNIYSRRRLILGVSFQVSKCPALAMSRGTSSMMVARPSAYSTIVLKERLSRALDASSHVNWKQSPRHFQSTRRLV